MVQNNGTCVKSVCVREQWLLPLVLWKVAFDDVLLADNSQTLYVDHVV